MVAELLVFPLIAAGIGWLTNVVAIRMLFVPRRPRKIFGYTLQGLLPRRQGELAKAIAEVVETELLPMDKLVARFDTREFRRNMTNTVVRHVENRLLEGLPGIIPLQIRRFVANNVREPLTREVDLLIGQMSRSVSKQLQEEARLGPVIEERVRELDLMELEALVLSLASRELRHIEFLGAVLGFIVGLIQLLLSSWLL
ncbi:MAG: DUF445 domain-containing protein [Limnochordia bacterium]